MRQTYLVQREDDNVYINVVINGKEGDYSASPNGASVGVMMTIASQNSVKNIPILEKCSDYYASIIRYTIPLNDIPLYIFPVIPNQGNPNKSPLVIGINYNGVNNSQNIIYTPINDTIHNQPPIQNQSIQVITPYYYSYSYQLLITCINTALRAAYVASGLIILFPNIMVPYFSYDSVTQLISLIIPRFFFTQVAPATSIPILYMNSALIDYLEAFPAIFYGYNNLFGRDFDFYFQPISQLDDKGYTPFGTVYFNPGPGNIINQPQYYEIKQEYSSLVFWNSLTKIIISSNNIPIRSEYVPTPNNQQNSNVSSTYPMMHYAIIFIKSRRIIERTSYLNPHLNINLLI